MQKRCVLIVIFIFGKMQKKLPKSIKPEEFKILISKLRVKDKEAKIAFLLAYEAGLRIAEVKALTKECISDNYITVLSGKGGKDRIVPLPKTWKPYMKEILPISKTIRSLQRNFATCVKKAQLNPEYTFHSLRHGFATRLIESGVPLSHVQALLGHSNISTTNVYTRARPMDALKSYEELF